MHPLSELASTLIPMQTRPWIGTTGDVVVILRFSTRGTTVLFDELPTNSHLSDGTHARNVLGTPPLDSRGESLHSPLGDIPVYVRETLLGKTFSFFPPFL